VVSWSITDEEHQKYYLIQKEQATLKVYRDYKEFVLEKTFLFQVDPSDVNKGTISAELDKKRISTELEKKFKDANFELSKRCTVENREWLISSDSQPQFKLIKRENNQIDVCVIADSNFLFSIDGGFETDLIAGKSLSPDIQQAFTDKKPPLLPNSAISVICWFITDDERQKHYLIQEEQKTLKVYRDYKLPLLRMARLSANVLICLFEGIVQTVDLHLKPDTLHCGVDRASGAHQGWHKKLRGSGGKSIDPLPWREGDKRTIGIGELAKRIKEKLTHAEPLSAAKFALEMIEGAEKVRFCSRP
jgi:hypothetical protein